MRLRVKCHPDSKAAARVEVPDNATLQQLLEAIAQQLRPGAPAQDFWLSFNKKAPLGEGSPDDPVSSLGVCNGDLLWVMGGAALDPGASAPSGEQEPQQKRAKESTPAGAGLRGPDPADAAGPSSPAGSRPPAGQLEQSCAHPEGGSGGEDLPPPSCKTPSFLLRVLAHNPAALSSPTSLLVLAAHAAMLETGFRPEWAPLAGDNGDGSAYALPPQAWPAASLCRVAYRGRAGPQGQVPALACTLQCSVMGDGVVVGASSALGQKARHLSLQASAFVRPLGAAAAAGAGPSAQPSSGAALPPDAGCSGAAAAPDVVVMEGQSLAVLGRWELPAAAVRRLWTELKDGVAIPMLVATHAEAGLPPPLGLLALPSELRLAVLRKLPAPDLAALSAACTELRHAAAGDALWRPLFGADFPLAPPSALSLAQSRGYKWAYGLCSRERAEREREARAHQRRFAPALPRLGPRPPFYPPPFPFGGPGVTGGDYDRFPQPFIGGGPGNYGGGGLGPGNYGGGRRQGHGSSGFRSH